MKHRILPRLLAGTLTLCLLLGGCSANPGKKASAPSRSPADEEIVTIGSAADYLLSTAAGYNKDLPDREELTDNFMGLTDDDPASRLQSLIMVSKAFGKLPEPVGNNKRLSPKDVDLSGVPEWASEELEKLKNAGVLAAGDLGSSKKASSGEETQTTIEEPQTESAGAGDIPDGAVTDSVTDAVGVASTENTELSDNKDASDLDRPITGKELKTFVRRIYALYGSSLKDDFYTAVNKKDLDTKEIPAGETDAGGTYDQRVLVQNQVNTIIKEIVQGDGYQPGSIEQKIKDFYESALDFQKRNALGAEPLRKYLDAVTHASTLQELSDAQILSLKEINCGSLISIMYMTDFRDTSKNMPTLTPPLEALGGSESDRTLNIRLLMLSGETKAQAAEHIQAYEALEQALTEYAPTAGEQSDASTDTRYVSLEELQTLFPGFDVKAIIEAGGDEAPSELCLLSPTLFEGFARLMQQETYLSGIKTALKLNILTNNYANLSQDFLDAFEAYEQETMGQEPSNNSAEEIACAMVQNSLGDYIDQLYAKRYFSPEAKQAVEEMIEQFISVYKERIQKLDWMSEETRQAAIEKLDGMKFFIGYPNTWSSTLDQLEITDSFFDNQIAISKLYSQRNREEAKAKNLGQIDDYMKVPVSTVNAYYDQYSNTMCFPAGILQSPAFDVHASLEENLGGIGATIAHEITHAFDNNGAKFDANGLQNDWWQASDYKKFQKLCDKAAKFYDGWEAAPGITINGTQTLGENIADIGGVACALEVLGKTRNPDYDAFFRSYAKNWLKCTTRARAESLAEIDEHSPGNLRVNRVLANFQEFYDTYDIGENDGMYVAPADRICIW